MGKSNVFSTFEDSSAKTTKHVQEGFEDLTDPYFIENVPTGLMKENVLLQICVWCDGSGGPSTCDEFVSLKKNFSKNNQNHHNIIILSIKTNHVNLVPYFFCSMGSAPTKQSCTTFSRAHKPVGNPWTMSRLQKDTIPTIGFQQVQDYTPKNNHKYYR